MGQDGAAGPGRAASLPEPILTVTASKPVPGWRAAPGAPLRPVRMPLCRLREGAEGRGQRDRPCGPSGGRVNPSLGAQLRCMPRASASPQPATCQLGRVTRASSSSRGDAAAAARASSAAELWPCAAGGALSPLPILPPFPAAGSALACETVTSRCSGFLSPPCRGGQPATCPGRTWLAVSCHLFLLCLLVALSLAALREARHGGDAVR